MQQFANIMNNSQMSQCDPPQRAKVTPALDLDRAVFSGRELCETRKNDADEDKK
jgi:hypothetical protein